MSSTDQVFSASRLCPNGGVYIHLADTENWMEIPISDPANPLGWKDPDKEEGY